jgi:hypothetical protein
MKKLFFLFFVFLMSIHAMAFEEQSNLVFSSWSPGKCTISGNTISFNGTWSGCQYGFWGRDVSMYDYIIIKYSKATGRIGVSVNYYTKTQSDANVSSPSSYIGAANSEGFAKIKIDKTTTLSDNPSMYISQRLRAISMQDQGQKSSVEIDGIYFESDAEFSSLKTPYDSLKQVSYHYFINSLAVNNTGDSLRNALLKLYAIEPQEYKQIKGMYGHLDTLYHSYLSCEGVEPSQNLYFDVKDMQKKFEALDMQNKEIQYGLQNASFDEFTPGLYDLTPLVKDAGFDGNHTVWGTNLGLNGGYSSSLVWNWCNWGKSLNFSQTIQNINPGEYTMRIQGFECNNPWDLNGYYANYKKNPEGTTNSEKTSFYINNDSKKLMNYYGMGDIGLTDPNGRKTPDGWYVPRAEPYYGGDASAHRFFQAGAYDSELTSNVTGDKLTLGIKSDGGLAYCCFDNVRLYYHGVSDPKFLYRWNNTNFINSYKDSVIECKGNGSISQTFKLPRTGKYVLRVNAFAQELLNDTLAFNQYYVNNSKIQSKMTVSVKSDSEPSIYETYIKNIFEGMSDKSLAKNKGEYKSALGFVPQTDSVANIYFKSGQYYNDVVFEGKKDQEVTVTIISSDAWLCAGNFKLLFYGTMPTVDHSLYGGDQGNTDKTNSNAGNLSTGIKTTVDDANVNDIYTITGQKVEGNVNTLHKGLYIINGKKVILK